MRLSAAIVGIVLGLALMLSGCGEDGSSAAGDSASVANTDSTATSKRAVPARTCHPLRAFIGSMADLRGKLARGLSYDDYLREVQSVRALYHEIEADKLSVSCLLTSGGPAERAFNLYIDAANLWGDCLATVACNTRSIESKLQSKWALAAQRLTIAQKGLRHA